MNQDPKLPTERDFDPTGCDLDAQAAWRNFGGLTLAEAKRRFAEDAFIYQEDFMFMGGKAFAFYFPAVEDYLRNVPDNSDDDDYESWILAHCLRVQFDGKHCQDVQHLAERVIDLACYVRENMRRFGADDQERKRIADAWTELVETVNRKRPKKRH